MVSLQFFIDLILLASGVTSASNRNEYQEYFLGGEGSWCIGLTTLPPSCVDCLEVWEPHRPGTPRASLGLYRDFFTFAFHDLFAVILMYRVLV
jgi:hypothetical protein